MPRILMFLQSINIDCRDGDFQAVGMVFYTGTNPAGAQAAGFFCGSTIAQDVIDAEKVRLRNILDQAQTAFKLVEVIF